MKDLQFEWDKTKNIANIQKHKVSFEEAKSVFYDENAKIIFDPDHSEIEDRYIILGFNSNLKMLVVVHVYIEDKNLIRIISARKATKKEIKNY